MNKNLLFILYILLFIILINILMVFSPGPLTEDTLVEIKNGTYASELSETLKKQEVIRNPTYLTIIMKLFSFDKKVAPGEFEIKKHDSLISVIRTIIDSKKHYFRKVTIPEGLTVKQVYSILNNNKQLKGNLPPYVKEGTLMPDTYFFAKGETRAHLINRMHSLMLDYLDKLWENRSLSLPYRSKIEALTMASMIEKETGDPSERYRIAGVFINRLKLGMKLQSDPTVAYGLGISDASKLTKANLKAKNYYNTYYVKGLPIGPIANPGKASLDAAFYPEKNNYLYFVANGKGGHVFSKTLEQHNKSVSEWRKINKNKK